MSNFTPIKRAGTAMPFAISSQKRAKTNQIGLRKQCGRVRKPAEAMRGSNAEGCGSLRKHGFLRVTAVFGQNPANPQKTAIRNSAEATLPLRGETPRFAAGVLTPCGGGAAT
jgi:hypothetical protein